MPLVCHCVCHSWCHLYASCIPLECPSAALLCLPAALTMLFLPAAPTGPFFSRKPQEPSNTRHGVRAQHPLRALRAVLRRDVAGRPEPLRESDARLRNQRDDHPRLIRPALPSLWVRATPMEDHKTNFGGPVDPAWQAVLQPLRMNFWAARNGGRQPRRRPPFSSLPRTASSAARSRHPFTAEAAGLSQGWIWQPGGAPLSYGWLAGEPRRTAAKPRDVQLQNPG